MIALPETSYKKATQALNFLARKKDGKINKMKAIKLIYLADRLHIRKYGRPIIGDMYWAMKMGPVGSQVKRAAELSNMSEGALSYAKKYIQPADEKKHYVTSVKPVDLDVFSKTDLECLEAVYGQFSDKDQFELRDITHQYPEWSKHERYLKSGKKRVQMDYEDFFSSTEKDDPLFAENKSDLALAKETFDEMKEVSKFFAR
ncbi:MAG TPA: Panacea domain-containing protein [Candidatus Paceibacterota bacterium]|nr:Panacea domain-containing protein [Candidatus Paceibacterota bacterium]